MTETNDLMEKIVSLSKRRGFIFPACEIYGGFANSYSYGPYGAELKNNIKKIWWKKFVQDKPDMVGLDGPIILHPKVWEASGHTTNFNDALVDCKKCKKRFRADHLVEQATGKDLEGDNEAMNKEIANIKCPECGKQDWTEARNFNMMFQTPLNNVSGEKEEIAYLRPETAQAIFVEFKNITDSMRVKIPFGIGQIGKAFRNEIVAGNFIFRLREFEQLEIEYFIAPDANWEEIFDKLYKEQEEFAAMLGIKPEDIKSHEHSKEKLAFYSKKTVDLEYKFPFGFDELFGLAYRTDYDLKQHGLEYFDQESNQRYIPHVIEPTFGLDRSILAALTAAHTEEEVKGEIRVVMKFPKDLAPVKVAILPLSKKPELKEVAEPIFNELKNIWHCEYDETQSIGKRYRRQDEIGTPFCVTVDFDSIEDKAVTIRDRDTMAQERIPIDKLKDYLTEKLS